MSERDDRSKMRDETLQIQSYNFFSYEQFGVTPDYLDMGDIISEGFCWSWCYQRVWLVFDKIADQLKQRPMDEQVTQKLDVGHAMFYVALCQASREKLLDDENMGVAREFWGKFFGEWRSWFKEYYPMYFLPYSKDWMGN